MNLVGMNIKVLLVDDNAEVRAALRRIIEKTSDIDVCGEAANGQEAIKGLEKLECDVVVLDVSLPDMSGLEVLKRIKHRWPDRRVLMVSVHSEELYAIPSLRAGASGYLTKDKAAEKLTIAIREVSNGRLHLSPSIADQLGGDNTDGAAGSRMSQTVLSIESDS